MPTPRRGSVARLIAIAFASSTGSVWADDPAPGQSGQSELSAQSGPVPTGVVLNGRTVGGPVLVARRADGLWLLRSDQEILGLSAPGGTMRQIEGETYVSLSSLPGLRAELVANGTVLRIEAEGAAFGTTRLGETRERDELSPIAPAAFLDYDLTLTADTGRISASGLIDAGLSGGWGVASTSALFASGGKRLTRLDSAVRIDLPRQRQQVLIGDFVSRGSTWSQPARIGGLRFGTEMSLDPTFITMATPTLSGSTGLPSTIDLLSDAGNRAYQVGPGQFQLDYLPQVTGAGDVTMIVRDITGTERRVTRRFYTGGELLQPGLSEFAVELGALRKAYGQSSFAYGSPTLSGYWRQGLSSWVTLTMQGAISGNVRTGGAEAALRIGHLGIATLALAGSTTPDRKGVLARAQVQRLTAGYSLTASYQRSSPGFRQIGAWENAPSETEELAVAGGLSLPQSGTINASLVHLRRGAERQRLASVSYGQNLGPTYLSLGLRQAKFASGHDTSIFAALTLPLGQRSHAALSADSRTISASFERSAPQGHGFGYRALAGLDRTQDAPWLEAGTTLRSAIGQADATIVSRGGPVAARILLQGGLVASEGIVAATPRIEQGMALVEVSSANPVGITVENRETARTASAGHPAIVTGLQPYSANRVGIDVDALALGESVPSGEQIAVPGWRKVARVRFGEGLRRPIRLHLLDAKGRPLPVGARVDYAGGTTLVGHDGEVFLPDAAPGQTLRATGRWGQCEAQTPQILEDDEMSRPRDRVCIAPAAKEAP